MNSDQRMSSTVEKMKMKSLPPVRELDEATSHSKKTQDPIKLGSQDYIEKPKLFSKEKSSEKVNPDNFHEITGNSFFNDANVNFDRLGNQKKAGLNTLGSTNKMIGKKPVSITPKEQPRIETNINSQSNQNPNLHKMNPTSNPQLNKIKIDVNKTDPMPDPDFFNTPKNTKFSNPANNQDHHMNESMSGLKIQRDKVKNDLNCTLNDASIMDYMVDENGYLMNEKGELIYDDDGKVVKLTDEQIDNFKENDLYEEIEC